MASKPLPQVNIQTSIGPVTGEYLNIPPENMEGIILLNTHPDGDTSEDPEIVKEIQAQMKSLFPKAVHVWITARVDMKITHLDPQHVKDGGEYLIGVSGDSDSVGILTEQMKKTSKFANSITFYKAK